MKNVLVFGASGFVGSNLIKKSLDELNLIPVARDASLNYVNVELSSPDFVSSLPKDVDVVIYLAQSNAYRNFPEGAKDMQQVNANAVLQIANWSIENNVEKIIYASTANVYADQNSSFTKDSPTNPSSFYGFSKLTGEGILKQFSSLISVDIFRFFSIYGPNQNGMLIPMMINRVRNSEKVTITNKEGLFLSPVYIDDVVNLLIERAKNIAETPTFNILNVSGEEVISLAEIVDIIGEKVKIEPNIEFIPGEERYLCFDKNSVFKDYISEDYKAISFLDGITKTLTYEI